jgi:hypothetical protein
VKKSLGNGQLAAGSGEDEFADQIRATEGGVKSDSAAHGVAEEDCGAGEVRKEVDDGGGIEGD